MKIKKAAVLIFVLLFIPCIADDSRHISFNNLSEWEPLLFPKIKKHSTYKIISEKGKNILQCEADGSASAILYKKPFSAYKNSRLKWKWKISNVYKNADPKKKSGDDFPVRIYINFKFDPEKASSSEKAKYNLAKLIYGEYPPHSSLNYVWSSTDVNERIITSPYTDRVKIIILQKGGSRINTWIEEQVDVLADYKKAFGEMPPDAASLAIMSDADNTGESAKSYVEYIDLMK